MVLKLRLEEDKHGHLRLDKVLGATETRYKKHFLDLGGMGLRELRLRGSDLLVLTGPTMDLDGTIAVYCWPNATDQASNSLMGAQHLKRLFDVPHGHGPTAGQEPRRGHGRARRPAHPAHLRQPNRCQQTRRPPNHRRRYRLSDGPGR